MVGLDLDPELSLHLATGGDCPSGESRNSAKASSNSRIDEFCGGMERCKEERHTKQITIFFNGQMCACDVTEIQARAIISMAKREMEERENKETHRENTANKHQIIDQQIKKNLVQSQPQLAPSPQLLNSGLSMKKSLQRFLQKRKTRISAASPYNRTRQLAHMR